MRYHDMIVKELESFGVARFEFGHGSKHPFVKWTGADGVERKHYYPETPSDSNGILNCRADLRRALRESFPAAIEPDALADEPEDDRPTVFLGERGAMVSSLDIAKRFRRNHKDVLRAIDGVAKESGPDFNQRNFAPIAYVDSRGRSQRAYDMTRDGFSLAAMSLTGAAATRWKVKYIEAFDAMEARLADLAKAEGQAEVAKLKADLEAMQQLLFEVAARSPAPAPAAELPPQRARRAWVDTRAIGRRIKRAAATAAPVAGAAS